MRATDLFGGPFTPPGFYYKTFIRPRRFWPLYEKFLRHAAGLGKLRKSQPEREWRTEYRRRHADVLVIGGGAAGLSAAAEAAELGADVVLADEGPEPGGRLLAEGGVAYARELAERARAAGVEMLANAPALGIFDGLVPVWQGDTLHQVRAQRIVFATGAIEQPLLFPGNDLPGVMLSGGARRLVGMYAVQPGTRAVVATVDDRGLHAALALLRRRGGDLLRGRPARARQRRPGGRAACARTCRSGARRDGARGARAQPRVAACVIGKPGSERGRRRSRATCSWCRAAARRPPRWSRRRAGRPRTTSRAATSRSPRFRTACWWRARSRARGTSSPPCARERSRARRRRTRSGSATRPPAPGSSASASVIVRTPLPAPVAVPPPVTSERKGKCFACLCEDVTAKDIHLSVEEGYDSIELSKRYTTTTMGPCQGRMCQLPAVRLMAKETGTSLVRRGHHHAAPAVARGADGRAGRAARSSRRSAARSTRATASSART